MLPKLRKIHLYLGCIFAPMLILFIITGCLQMFNLHHSKKDGSYTPPQIVSSLTQVHMEQRFTSKDFSPESSYPLKTFIVVMSVGLLATTLLGIFMAFKVTKNKFPVWICLGMGILIPAILLWMGRGFK